MMLHRMSAYHNRQILCSARLAYSVYYTVSLFIVFSNRVLYESI